jgi:hypothetical protein
MSSNHWILPPFFISGDFPVQFEVEEYPCFNVCLVILLGAASSQGLPSTLNYFCNSYLNTVHLHSND